MVKGISRRVIVVRSPDPRFFEQAIFLMREDALNQEGVTSEQVLSEARNVAAGYWKKNVTGRRRLLRRLPALLWGGLGAMGASLVWLGVLFF